MNPIFRHELKVWPEEKPESIDFENQYLIWIPSGGWQITKYSNDSGKAKVPYFYWCGAPKKVWWVKLAQPSKERETDEK